MSLLNLYFGETHPEQDTKTKAKSKTKSSSIVHLASHGPGSKQLARANMKLHEVKVGISLGEDLWPGFLLVRPHCSYARRNIILYKVKDRISCVKT